MNVLYYKSKVLCLFFFNFFKKYFRELKFRLKPRFAKIKVYIRNERICLKTL